jgi:hypothetical protein
MLIEPSQRLELEQLLSESFWWVDHSEADRVPKLCAEGSAPRAPGIDLDLEQFEQLMSVRVTVPYKTRHQWSNMRVLDVDGDAVDIAFVVLKTYPGVTDAGFVGVPDDCFCNAVGAVVATSEPIDSNELLTDIKAQLAAFKAPRHIVFTDDLGRAANPKLDYAAPRALIEAELERDAAVGTGATR